jgi:hypothetical protein
MGMRGLAGWEGKGKPRTARGRENTEVTGVGDSDGGDRTPEVWEED